MSFITTDTLHDLGIQKTPEEEASIIDTFDRMLEERVGQSMREALNDDQAARFLELTGQGDQAAVTGWLQTNIPEYEDIVKAEYDILLGELAENAETLGQ